MKTKSAFVALVGNSNVGKSTLLNLLVGCKVSIVTHKVQTTRTTIRATLTQKDTQIVFVDTPGIFKPKRSLESRIVKNAWSAFSGVDLFCIVVDPRYEIDDPLRDIIKKSGQNIVLLINKIDLISPSKLLEVTDTISKIGDFKKVFMISALKNSGVEDLKEFLLLQAKEGPWYFDPNDQTDMPIKFNLAEILREKLFLRFHQEIPYCITTETEQMEETHNKFKIHQVIYVTSQSHKSIVIGAKGATIKAIRVQSAKEMEFMLQKKVDLFLFVKVRQDWQQNQEIMSTISY